MPDKNKSIRTDLACECVDTSAEIPSGIEYSEETIGDIKIMRMKINSESESKKVGKPRGEYRTFICGDLSKLGDTERGALSALISAELISMTEKLCEKRIGRDLSVLVAGLGNADMTPDAIGPLAVTALTVTGHIFTLDPELFGSLGCARLYAIAPGVLGETGIESKELIRGAVAATDPDLVIVIDALASRDAQRLAATVQMSDSGISPGSGVKNSRKEISRATLGVPVIALGVPTVVDSAALVAEALKMVGVSADEAKLSEGESLFVAPRDIDLVVEVASKIFADAIDLAFGINS